MYRDKIGVIEDSFQAFLTENARFTKKEEYPIIEKEMIAKTIPKKILPFSKAINSKEDLKDTFICFYERDICFKRVSQNPKKYLSFFKRCGGIIGLDFSIHDDMPLIPQKSQINKNLSLTYYYGSNGIPIIPNIREGSDLTTKDFLKAFPKDCIIALGSHGFCKTIIQKAEWFCFLERVEKELKPSSIVVYGSLYGKQFDAFKERNNIYFYPPWITNKHKKRLPQ